jgi:peroxiredoxin Q/BCP
MTPDATTAMATPLAVGTPAPAFDLPATGGRQIKLSDYRGRNLIVVFYPKDQTPGCTQQLCALRDDLAMFNALQTDVLASNPDSLESHERFVTAQGYNFPILVDAQRTMARDYQVLKENNGIQRTVYIIDGQGIIRFGQQGMPSDSDLADLIRSLGQ